MLGRYIPEYEALVAFFQHNVYHYYTADEHTLIAIANAERLKEDKDRSATCSGYCRTKRRCFLHCSCMTLPSRWAWLTTRSPVWKSPGLSSQRLGAPGLVAVVEFSRPQSPDHGADGVPQEHP